MEVRIEFTSTIYIKGDTLDEIRSKWEDMPLFSADALSCNADYEELVSAEINDGDSCFTDITGKFK